MREVWGWDFGDLSTVTVHVRRLRGKVEHDPARPRLIRTVWGVGYRFDPDGSSETEREAEAGTEAVARAGGGDGIAEPAGPLTTAGPAPAGTLRSDLES
jgi:DNA-binding winged helix-turn-helix (wHTH) protein